MDKSDLVEVTLTSNKCLVWNTEDVLKLRVKHRIVGNLIGTVSQFQQQNQFTGMPLLLSNEEVTLGLLKDNNSNNNAADVNWTFPQTEHEKLRYAVFENFWNRGYYLTPGSKFGGDFLAYPGDPFQYHAHYVVIVLPYTKFISPLDVISYGRLAVTVKKTPALASVHPDTKEVLLLCLDWQGVS